MYLFICIYFKVAWHSLVTFDALESLLTDLDIKDYLRRLNYQIDFICVLRINYMNHIFIY